MALELRYLHFFQYALSMTTTGYIIVVLLIAGFIAGVPGLIVYQLWARRCSRCGHWRASSPHSGFMDLGPDEDGFNTLECQKCHFRKRNCHLYTSDAADE